MRQPGSVLLGALALGAVAGMRSLVGPALLSRALAGRSHAPAREPARSLASTTAARLLPFLALAELIGDKLPITPDRTLPPSLAGRVASGALAGAALAEAHGESPAPAAVIGAAAAFGSAHAMIRLRKAAADRWPVGDPVVGAMEDALAVGLGWAVLQGGVLRVFDIGTGRSR